MATAHKKRSKKNRSRKFKRPVRGVVHDGAFAIDYSKLPRDLDADALAELQAELPKPKKSAEPVDHSVLFNLTVSDMIEAAEVEKVEVDGKYMVDTGHVVAFDGDLKYKIRRVGGWKSTLLSGEGLVLEFSGKGTLWLQTRNINAMVGWITPVLPS